MSAALESSPAPVTYDTHPDRYAHWKLSFDGPVATLAMDIDEDKGLRPGYKLKLNSYDLGVDIELADALNRIRFEHPEVKCVVITSARERMFCSGANIYMLGSSTHAWKVNFCKFTNETRNGIEDSSRHSGLKFLAACNGMAAGGGYELALACDEILLVDDGNSAVSLPETPLLAVLPGTGGTQRLARLVGKARAIELMATGTTMTFEEAVAIGLVNKIFAAERFMDDVLAYARQFVPPARAAKAVGSIKRAVQTGLEVGFEQGLALERELQQQLFQSDDAREGLAAYNEKRKPAFKGK